MLQQTIFPKTFVAPHDPAGQSVGVPSANVSGTNLPGMITGESNREALAGINIFYLPATSGAFGAFLLVLVLLAVSMGLHIFLSSQLWSKARELNALQQQYLELKEENAELIFQVNQQITLDSVYAQAVQLGYEPMTERKFVVGDHLLVNKLDEHAIAEAMRRSQ